MCKLKEWFDEHFWPEEIDGHGRCPTYLYRWTLLKATAWSLYLHHFVGDDWSLDLHDHPKRFISIGLWGRYRETTPQDSRIYRAPWICTWPASHIHRLSMIDQGECWTCVIVLKPVREWGFWHAGEFIHWRKYVKSEIADTRKACP
jgi:hypothetical protein